MRFMGTTLRVECDPAMADWLPEFFRPSFEVGPGDGVHASIALRVILDADRYSGLQDELAHRLTRPLPCFQLDQRLVTLEGWRDGPSAVAHDDRLDCFYRIEGTSVEVVARPGEPSYRIASMRVIRELLTASDWRPDTDLELHAAAFERDGAAYVVTGPKRSGKTMALMRALAGGGAMLIANDRLFVRLSADAIHVRGVPTAWNVRAPTVAEHPCLLRAIPRVRSAARLTIAEAREAVDRVGPAAPENPPKLSTAQVLAAFGAKASPGASLAAIAVLGPREPHQSGASFARPRPEPLRDCLYGASSKGARPTIFETLAQGAAAAPASLPPAALLDRLSRLVLSDDAARARLRPCFDSR